MRKAAREGFVMSPTLTCIALALVGVDLGYQPTTNGRVEFIIQISPSTLQAIEPGRPIEIDAPREAQDLRPSRFLITLGNESLPHAVPVALSTPPATAPIVQATVMPTVAMAPATSPDGTPAGQPVNVPPPSSGPPVSAAYGGSRPPIQDSPAGPAGSGDSTIAPFAPAHPYANGLAQPDHPWLAMCLLVIALAASNGYVGWLFWDARQRYLGLLRRTFSTAPQAAEA